MIPAHYETVLPFQYSFAGHFTTREEWIHPSRVIDTYEAMYIIEGEVHLKEEGTEYSLRAGDMILLRPNVRHGGTRKSFGATAFFWAHFSAASLENTEIIPGVFTPMDSDRLISAFKQLLHIANTPGYPPYAPQGAMAVLLSEISLLQTRAALKLPRLATEVLEWIRIHADRKLSAHSIAERFTYHPDYLSGVMKQSFGKGLSQIITEQRMNLIKTQLLTTNLSVKELAAKLDFENEGQLVHYFKYHEGISPVRYRNRYVQTHLNRR